MEVIKNIILPTSKSIVNRLLIIEAISKKIQIPDSSICCWDTHYLAEALRKDDKIKDIGQSGTAMRFLTAFLSIQESKEYILTGSQSLRERPISNLIDAIYQLGGNIEYIERSGYLPVRIKGRKLKGGNVSIDASQSSQFVSALMLIAPSLSEGLRIKITNPASMPYIILTQNIMQQSGVEVEISDDIINIAPQTYNDIPQFVESDFSSAVFWFAYIAVNKLSELKLQHFIPDSYQPDSRIVEIIKDFGVNTKFANNYITITKSKYIKLPDRVNYDFRHTPDLVPVMAAMCCLLNVSFVFDGIANLRIKESNRIEAMVRGLQQCGYMLSFTENKICWDKQISNDVKIPIIDTCQDHRIAMAFALIASKRPIKILHPEVVEKSYPAFWKDLKMLSL